MPISTPPAEQALLKMIVLPDIQSVAQRAATIIALEARAAVASRGRFTLAVSGGHTPWLMLSALVDEDVPWEHVHLLQVDERVAPAEDPDRNLAHLRESLLDNVPLPSAQIHAMPVEAGDLEAACAEYAATLRAIAGSPPMLDLVHLGLGPDGHTASLIPEDEVLEAMDVDVALTGPYQGRRRMTLTYPVINHARRMLWVVTGEDKVPMLRRLLDGDPSIPAGRVKRTAALVVADRAAAGPSAAGPGEGK